MKLSEMNGKNLIASRVRETRKAKHMTQKDLAGAIQLLGVMLDRMSINRIESGHRCVSDYELVAFAQALEVSADWLLYGTEGLEKE